MVIRSQLIPTRIIMNGKIAELITAKKTYKCNECGYPIVPHSDYYKVTIGGGGLGSLKFPDRVHVHCIEKYMEAVTKLSK